MKDDSKLEVDVFAAIQEKGEATLDELYQYLTEKMEVEITKQDLLRYVRRWKAKKVVAVCYINGDTVFKLADIPPWYASGIMAICKGTVQTDMKTALEALDEQLKGAKKIIEPRSVYGDYATFELTFEAVDPILGGRIENNCEELRFPREGNKLMIPMNWFRGLIRDNAPLMELPASIAYHLAFSNGSILGEPKLNMVTLKVKQGTCKYEALPKGSQFSIKLRAPMRGTKLKTEADLREWFKRIEEIPLRGLGANPFAYGGRIRLLEMKKI